MNILKSNLLNNAEFVTILIKIIIIIMIMIMLNLVVNLVLDIIYQKESGVTKKSILTNIRIIKRIKSILIFVITFIACLFQIPNFNTISWSILSGAGIISLILGYAAQKTLSNLFCGLGIAFSDPFEIGDYIKCVELDLSGYVEDITLRHTVIRTVDNRRVIVPNSKLDDMTIENYNHTDNEVCRFVDYAISYSSDVNKAISILKEEMDKMYNPNTNGINKHVEFPKVRVSKLDTSSVILRCWVWGADNAMTHENIFNLNYIVKDRFEKEGIEIPINYVTTVSTSTKKVAKKKTTKKK